MVVVAVALLGLIALLATLQYQWLGRISDAEREHMRATLNTSASGFAQDFDGELTRAYLLFQMDPQATGSLESRVALRFDRWQATARYPRVIKDIYNVGPDVTTGLQQFNPATRALDPVSWPAMLEPIRQTLAAPPQPAAATGLVVRQMPSPIWEGLPALLIPMPQFFFDQQPGRTQVRVLPTLSYIIVRLDRDYITREMLPALAQQHFRRADDRFDYQVAVVSAADRAVVYHSTPAFTPTPDAKADAAMDLFQVRMQDFASIVSEVRRFNATFIAGPLQETGTSTTVTEHIVLPPGASAAAAGRQGGPFSFFVQQNGSLNSTALSAGAAAARFTSAMGTAHWRLLVKHPSGSLEAAVNAARRRNLIISSSVLSVLGASVGLLVLSTRRAQELARQQMEFVAAVSHELRTPLAVIRSAGENLADGVVKGEDEIRKYGDLVRHEGRRLTDMVEQILEFAGIGSGQRAFALSPVALAPLLQDIVESRRALLENAGIRVEFEIAEHLPPVLGDQAALRRVFENLVANATKYGEAGGWLGIRAHPVGREVHVTVADRGIGIAAGEQTRIFEPFYRTPDAIAARIQGTGLGLSLVQRIVQAHDGNITVHSEPGAGSEFTVALPAASEEPIGHPALPDAPGHGSHA
jgi:two-component system, OmpR family, sensor histidine kinase SenX3